MPQKPAIKPRETPSAISAKLVYYSFGTKRTLPRVAEATGFSLVAVRRWSAIYEWQAGSEAFDLDEQSAKIQELHDALSRRRQESLEFQNKIGQALAARGASLLLGKTDKDGNEEIKPLHVDGGEAIAMARLGFQLQSETRELEDVPEDDLTYESFARVMVKEMNENVERVRQLKAAELKREDIEDAEEIFPEGHKGNGDRGGNGSKPKA